MIGTHARSIRNTILVLAVAVLGSACSDGQTNLTRPSLVPQGGLASHPSGVVTIPDPVITVDVETCEEVTLSWTNVPVSGHVADNWHVQISDDNFVTTLFNNPDYGSTSLTFALAPGTYQARVKADNNLDSRVNNSGFVIVEFTVAACAAQACSPGFWRQDQHGDDYAAAIAVLGTDDFHTLFGLTPVQTQLPSDWTLEDALANPGGNSPGLNPNNADFVGTGALLSAAHAGVSYPYTQAEIVAAVQAAYGIGTPGVTLADLAATFAPGHDCPLGADSGGAE
jgi:hypothetical protein